METSYHAETAERKPDFELIAEADYRRELKRLSDIAFVFLSASDGDPAQAENLLDDFIDLVFEGGALSTWRYRILLAEIREGL
ncbi:MAG: hypothetical protein Q8S00_12505 [Deltaproteobacteria bacterium]|nr:hypothetical protein [Deltaproteobacteria bacterium]